MFVSDEFNILKYLCHTEWIHHQAGIQGNLSERLPQRRRESGLSATGRRGQREDQSVGQAEDQGQNQQHVTRTAITGHHGDPRFRSVLCRRVGATLYAGCHAKVGCACVCGT